MSNYRYKVNDNLRVDGENYQVIGAICYSNQSDQCEWVEYSILNLHTKEIAYLSIDDVYHEYALYRISNNSASFREASLKISGFHKVDSGYAKVTSFIGRVDVAVGDCVSFTEYEDHSEEKIRSIEQWEDEVEYSTGYYLDEDEIVWLDKSDLNSGEYESGNNTYGNSGYYQWNSARSFCNEDYSSAKKIGGILVGALILVALFTYIFLGTYNNNKKIIDYLSNSNGYEYLTSITSNKEEREQANVYTSTYSLDFAVKDIVTMLGKNLISVQQNNEDGDTSVAILTKKEYCFVYLDEENVTMIQVSSRLYAYTSDNDLYHSRNHSNRYFRRYYYSNAFSKDKKSYKKYKSSYTTFDDSTVNTNYSDPYRNYSESIRRDSSGTRSSTGGGTGFGK